LFSHHFLSTTRPDGPGNQQYPYSTPWLTILWRQGIVSGMTDRLDTVFSALADPTRRAILSMLLEDDMAVTDVAEPFAMSLAAISKHLGVLADAGLISRERRGRVIWCKLEPDALRGASVWMQGFGQFEPLDLDAFERFLDNELLDEAD
jgi:DNA-binding transcriptional ArsR family regulator